MGYCSLFPKKFHMHMVIHNWRVVGIGTGSAAYKVVNLARKGAVDNTVYLVAAYVKLGVGDMDAVAMVDSKY